MAMSSTKEVKECKAIAENYNWSQRYVLNQNTEVFIIYLLMLFTSMYCRIRIEIECEAAKVRVHANTCRSNVVDNCY